MSHEYAQVTIIATAISAVAAGVLARLVTLWLPQPQLASPGVGDRPRRVRTPWWVLVGTGGAAGALLAWRLPTATGTQILVLAAWLVFAQAGLLLSAVDIAVHRLPTPILTVSGALAGTLIAAGTLAARRPGLLLAAVAAAGCVGGVYLLLALAAPTQIGMGDVRLAALAGLLLGTRGPAAVVAGAVLPYVLALPFALSRLRQPRRPDLPFGPFLTVGAVAGAILATG